MSLGPYPSDYRYTKDHEWAHLDGELVRVGITAFAVEQLGDVTLIDLPSVGDHIRAGERFGDIESVKTVSELFGPINGEVVEVNAALENEPELVNDSVYDQGWMIRIKPNDPSEFESLLSSDAYIEYLEGLQS